MPFLGVRPEREYLFTPTPKKDVGVNDAHAWRLNPKHRHVYNKLHVALSQGLKAAPSGVSPLLMGLQAEDKCFVKPIFNLGGMSLNTVSTTATTIAESTINQTNNNANNCAAGSFWCEFLEGPQTSSDVLILNGQAKWFAHTKAADERNNNRPIYWEIGADCAALEPSIEKFVNRELEGYTGLCNIEMIGNHIIEAHLRGSNAFFDYYCEGFMAAWVKLVDQQAWNDLEPIKQGCLYSIFSLQPLPDNAETIVASFESTKGKCARLYRDGIMHDRQGIIFTDTPDTAQQIEQQLLP